MNKNSENIVVIGAGIGGLATALRLSKDGHNVTILEKNSKAGGRLNRIEKGGWRFDTGPSFFSMSYEFKEFFDSLGEDFPFEFDPVDPLYTVTFRGSDRKFTLYRDIKKLAKEFEGIEENFEDKMNRYLEHGGKLFHGTIEKVVKQNFDSKIDYIVKLMGVDPKLALTLLSNFWEHACKYFESNEAREIVSLVSFFLGSTPFDTNSIYSLLSYTEFVHDGYFNVRGGMYEIVNGMVKLAEKRGINIIYNCEIVEVVEKSGQVKGIFDRTGKLHKGDIFVVNADAALFRGQILKRNNYSEEKLSKMKWTMGTLTVYVGLDCKLPEITLHNYYLGDNFVEYSRRALNSEILDQKPYFYVNALSRPNPECAPEGCEALFFVVPVPDLRYKKDWSDKDQIVDSILEEFGNRIGRDIRKNIIFKEVYTPTEWRDQFNLYQGSALGLAHNIMQVGGFRPSNFDEKLDNLFYVGASTAPGTGIPMAIISSKLTTERVINYITSTK
ncbi:MAG: phytoene desaturase family protein [Bacteroidales bacterium]